MGRADKRPRPATYDDDAGSMDGKSANDDPQRHSSHTPTHNPCLIGIPLYMTMLAVNLRMLVSSLNRTILNPLAPLIAADFHPEHNIEWHFSACFFIQPAFQPLYNRLYTVNLKWPYLACTIIFELGLVLCATATTSNTFLAGRAIAGFGGAAGFIGSLMIVSASVPLRYETRYVAVLCMMFALGSLCGPLVGTAFASQEWWRGAFWMSAFMGAIVLLIVAIYLHTPPGDAMKTNNLRHTLRNIAGEDWLGALLAAGAILAYIIAMQQAGVSRAWNSLSTISLFAGSGFLLIAFVVREHLMGEKAGIKPRIFCQRSVYVACLISFAASSAFYVYLGALPTYFQLLGYSQTNSVVQSLAFVIGAIVTVCLSAALLPLVGYVHPALLSGGLCAVAGSGLAQLWSTEPSTTLLVTASLLFGLGIGLSLNMPFLSVQAAFHGPDRNAAASCVVIAQTLGSMSVIPSQTIYTNCLKRAITQLRNPALKVDDILAAGTTGLRCAVSKKLLPVVLDASIFALRMSLVPVTVTAGIAFLATFALPVLSMAKQQEAVIEEGEQSNADSKEDVNSPKSVEGRNP